MHSGSMRVNYRERHSDDIGVVHQIEFPIRYLFDEYARESAMRDLMSQVRAQRSRIIAKEISRLIGELEEEEAGG